MLARTCDELISLFMLGDSEDEEEEKEEEEKEKEGEKEEWLWENILAGSEQTRLVLHKCSSESGEPTATFNCSLCHFGTKSIDQFRKHLSTDKEHAKEEMRLPASRKRNIKENRRSRVADFDRKGKRTK
ncbi:hypothetical protein BRARA_C03379 [Brassica rapa]|uniref:Uncharacterized protein n=1 Tax=Brassica campestris TaxID=3711 RepID=A0A398A715_BRACM|nr:hypothetical protein BRARA_C03379 [Brassica rapa]